MKKNLIYGIALLLGLMFAVSGCGEKSKEKAPAANVVAAPANGGGLKIAYVDVDSILLNYNWWRDMDRKLTEKAEAAKTKMNQKLMKHQKDVEEFQKKVKYNGFLSQERAQQEANRIGANEQKLQQEAQKLEAEMAQEAMQYNKQLMDSINNFLSIYNETAGYDFILNKPLKADPQYNVTKQIVDGLNARYKK